MIATKEARPHPGHVGREGVEGGYGEVRDEVGEGQEEVDDGGVLVPQPPAQNGRVGGYVSLRFFRATDFYPPACELRRG